jgi:hypothetical protein
MKNLEIGQICFVIDPEQGPRPVIVEELIERKSKHGTELFYVFLAGPPNNRRQVTEQELGNIPFYATIEEVQEHLKKFAMNWIKTQCETAERLMQEWYPDILNPPVQQPVKSTSSNIFEELSELSKPYPNDEKAKNDIQNDAPEIKIIKPKGRPPTKKE